MRCVIVGDWHSDLHEEVLKNAFIELNVQVVEFKWHNYFKSLNLLKSFVYKLQNKFIIGPVVKKINTDFLKLVESNVNDLDFIFFYRNTHITSCTITKLKSTYPMIKLFSYNNDNAFSKGHNRFLWKNYIDCLPFFDRVFSYRPNIIEDYKKYNSNVSLLMPWYSSSRNYKKKDVKKDIDIIFIGHFEDDGRYECIKHLVDNGVNVKLFGPPLGWNNKLLIDPSMKHLYPVKVMWGDEYNNLLNRSKISLCFLSKLNNDLYTRRCFEIPASNSLLMCEYNIFIESFFPSDSVALFKNKQELLDKVLYLLSNPNVLELMTSNSHTFICDSHEVTDRANYILSFLDNC